VASASRVPTAVLGLDDVGSLTAGLRADLLVVDEDLRPERVMRAGEWVR
jgi:N-acetylglucosamine-6-phosphate deacetylase